MVGHPTGSNQAPHAGWSGHCTGFEGSPLVFSEGVPHLSRYRRAPFFPPPQTRTSRRAGRPGIPTFRWSRSTTTPSTGCGAASGLWPQIARCYLRGTWANRKVKRQVCGWGIKKTEPLPWPKRYSGWDGMLERWGGWVLIPCDKRPGHLLSMRAHMSTCACHDMLITLFMDASQRCSFMLFYPRARRVVAWSKLIKFEGLSFILRCLNSARMLRVLPGLELVVPLLSECHKEPLRISVLELNVQSVLFRCVSFFSRFSGLAFGFPVLLLAAAFEAHLGGFWQLWAALCGP